MVHPGQILGRACIGLKNRPHLADFECATPTAPVRIGTGYPRADMNDIEGCQRLTSLRRFNLVFPLNKGTPASKLRH